jgi:hypothetical protein
MDILILVSNASDDCHDKNVKSAQFLAEELGLQPSIEAMLCGIALHAASG